MSDQKRVMLLGATGTIGRATAKALVEGGHDVVCVVRPSSAKPEQPHLGQSFPGADIRYADVTDVASLGSEGFRGDKYDAVVSCLSSRTGAPKDAWAIDHAAQINALQCAQSADVNHFVLLSAICVQKPKLVFQHAKLAFEKALRESGLDYSIVRPTAFFKSLSGQVERVQKGKAFMVFGNGELTRCKPISDGDLARYLVDCLHNDERRNRILPIGGPGAALSPKQQAEELFALAGKEPKFTHVPVALMNTIIAFLSLLGKLFPAAANKAELARIGHYYGTESMLVLNAETGTYDADATPSYGTQTLFDYYRQLLSGEQALDRGDHAVF